MAWKEAEDVAHDIRLVGDLCIAAYFGAEQDRGREELRREYRALVDAWKADGERSAIDGIVQELRAGERPVLPLHWEIEFPEVFGRRNPGFDAMVGNPPFLGGNRISSAKGLRYLDWLAWRYAAASRTTDLCAYFFRGSFALLRGGGCAGLVATNSICQGDTRATGLQAICEAGGWIYDATRRKSWPGLAAVVVSVIHIAKTLRPPCHLNGKATSFISAFLFHDGGHRAPYQLHNNYLQSMVGCNIIGIGFVFEDDNEGATPLAQMRRLVENDKRNLERIRSYIGGEEFNSDPAQRSNRFIIDFEEMSQDEAMTWPDLFAIVNERVRPQRQRVQQRDRREIWWWHATRSPEVRRYLLDHERFLALSQTSTHLAVSFLTRGVTIAHTIVAFLFDSIAALAVLQSFTHELWARFFASSMKDDLRYTPTDCFETFPFPPNWQSSPALEATGRIYYDFRATLMSRNDEGLTKTYNRFHDPNERSADILRLRELHAALDRAVLDAYGWTDVPTDCDFFLDYEIDEETWGDKKKPYRFRWPDAIRDEVLARLLYLNQKRYQEEVAAGLHGKLDHTLSGAPAKRAVKPLRKTAKANAKSKAPAPSATLPLFPQGEENDT
jgi:hypothetical protein